MQKTYCFRVFETPAIKLVKQSASIGKFYSSPDQNGIKKPDITEKPGQPSTGRFWNNSRDRDYPQTRHNYSHLLIRVIHAFTSPVTWRDDVAAVRIFRASISHLSHHARQSSRGAQPSIVNLPLNTDYSNTEFSSSKL